VECVRPYAAVESIIAGPAAKKVVSFRTIEFLPCVSRYQQVVLRAPLKTLVGGNAITLKIRAPCRCCMVPTREEGTAIQCGQFDIVFPTIVSLYVKDISNGLAVGTDYLNKPASKAR